MILGYLNIETEPFEKMLAKARTEIDFISEYRARLIADVVTGQLNVRGIDLPELEETLTEPLEADYNTEQGDEMETADGEVDV